MSLTSGHEVRRAIERTWRRAKEVLTQTSSTAFYATALERLRVFHSELLDLQEHYRDSPLAGGKNPEGTGASSAPAKQEGGV